MDKTYNVDELIGMHCLSWSVATVFYYYEKYGTKQIDSEEEADAEYIYKWYRGLPEEEQKQVYMDSIVVMKEMFAPEEEPTEEKMSAADVNDCIQHVGYSAEQMGYDK